MVRTSWRAEIPSRFGPVVIRGAGPNGGSRRAVIALHGMDRSAVRYQRQCAAALPGTLVLAPEFDGVRFPGWRSYNLLRMIDQGDRPMRREETLLPVLERLIEFASGLSDEVSVYGHSAGAQLLQRWSLFAPETLRGARLVAANPGWSTAPVADARFPYGIDGAPLAPNLNEALALPLQLLIGADDTEENHRTLRRDRGADRQGLNRRSRAVYLLDAAQRAAEQSNARLNWSLTLAPGAGHSNAEMIRAASSLLVPEMS